MKDEKDIFNLQRFVNAQDGIINQVFKEIHRGHKQSHWMWFIFPQLDGLGYSHMAKNFAIRNLDEARAYLSHPILGSRLEDCTAMMLDHSQQHITSILGTPDDYKFRSAMTLFSLVADSDSVFHEALDVFFHGKRDPKTLELLHQTTA